MQTVIDVANAHKMHAWPLEIFMGLVYLDYTDDPTKELRKADGTLAVDLNKLGLVGRHDARQPTRADSSRSFVKASTCARCRSHMRKPFRFLLCGDPALIAEMRALLLAGHDETRPAARRSLSGNDSSRRRRSSTNPNEVRAIVFLGRPGDAAGADFEALSVLRVPIFALTVDPAAPARPGPPSLPAPGTWREYVVPAISREALRGRVLPASRRMRARRRDRGRPQSSGRCAKPSRLSSRATRRTTRSKLRSRAPSWIIFRVVGVVLGAFASAGDMVAITGIQVMLMLHIEAAYGRDPDMQRTWQLLPVIGGGFGWRTLARELAGFVPVAGIAIKGAIAYAGTIVVGEGVTFFYEHGAHMTQGSSRRISTSAPRATRCAFARDLAAKLRKPQ